MKVTLLGTGGPRPDPARQGPATLVEVANLRLLFDAGRGVATQLVKADISLHEIDAVFITHHHFDHIGGLGDLLMAAWNGDRTRPLNVYGPKGTRRIVEALFGQIYASDIRFRIREAEMIGAPIPHPSEVFRAFDVGAGVIESNPKLRLEVGPVEHGSLALELDAEEWGAVGYRIEGDDRTVTIAGDAVCGPRFLAVSLSTPMPSSSVRIWQATRSSTTRTGSCRSTFSQALRRRPRSQQTRA